MTDALSSMADALHGHPPEVEPIRMRTLVQVRWFAIAGQTTAVIVALLMGIGFAVGPVLALIGAAAVMNIWLTLWSPPRTSARRAAVQLSFDVVQISILMALTGGLANPFTLLVLVPVTVAATALTLTKTLLLGTATMAMISAAALFALPLYDAGGQELTLSPTLALGHWTALMIGVVFFAGYAHRVSVELQETSNALFATQMALSREQRLQHLGGVVAAAAHEMGTPLATIKLIAGELARDLADRPDIRSDMVILRESAQRCADILRGMGRAGKDDLHLRSAPLGAVLADAAEPHAGRGPAVEIRAAGPHVRRDPAIIHALRNLIQNAVDFASSRVTIEAQMGNNSLCVTIRDDGPGYPPALLARIDEAYLIGWRGDQGRQGYDGMGLGLFIAKTLLERSGARLTFANGGPGAVVSVCWPLDRIVADGRASLGGNPTQPL